MVGYDWATSGNWPSNANTGLFKMIKVFTNRKKGTEGDSLNKESLWILKEILRKELKPWTRKLALSKWKCLSMSQRVLIQQMDSCWFHVCTYDVIFKQVLELWRHKQRHHQNTTFVMKLEKLLRNFFIIHIRPNLRFNFSNHTRLERFRRFFLYRKFLDREVGVWKYWR